MAAIKARDRNAASALRSALSSIDNAGAVERSGSTKATLGVGVGDVARRELSEQDMLEILRAEVRERSAAAAEYERLGRGEEARRLRAEAEAIASHLDGA